MQKGSYAKGVAKRDEILRTALDVIARNGYRSTSVRDLADEVGLSQAGLLHYFSSKEQLFVEVLRARDEVDTEMVKGAGLNGIEAFVAIVRHNMTVPGLVELYSALSAEATEIAHPAHAFIGERYRELRIALAADFRDRRRGGDLPTHLDPDQLAISVIALSDGLQTQWLIDPSIDMAGTIQRAWDVLSGRTAAARP